MDNMIRVYKIQLVGFNGPCLWETVEGAVEEVKSLLTDGTPGDKIHIEIARVPTLYLEALDEFAGY